MTVMGIAAATNGVTILVSPLLAIGTQFSVQMRRYMEKTTYPTVEEVIHLDELKGVRRQEKHKRLMELGSGSYTTTNLLLITSRHKH
jgi:hypothetical protein